MGRGATTTTVARRKAVLGSVLCLSLLVVLSGCGGRGPTPAGISTQPTSTAGQGLVSVSGPSGSASIVYRGGLSIPLRLVRQGWQHIGDPGAGGRNGGPRNYVFDAYEGAAGSDSKLFEVTDPSGQPHDFVHRLVPHEAYNNSFAAVSPDGNWLVSGEWGSITRLLVFPAPLLNGTAPVTGPRSDLELAGYIELGRYTLKSVQGCDFATDQILLCSSDATKQILKIQLAKPLRGTGSHISDSVRRLSVFVGLPLQSTCKGTFEAEGIDYFDSRLRVAVIPPQPCWIDTTVYVYDHRFK
ncbi:MAG TPA: hypothetical protein VFH70_04710 [Acidimicrobiales bacterium]|nr:hypothetical protein [Acidimicrobiales bacterium]